LIKISEKLVEAFSLALVCEEGREQGKGRREEGRRELGSRD
jgi:hypothetical protein